MKHLPTLVLAAALIAVPCALTGCQLTPTSSSWATDVYRMRFATLKPGMTTNEITTTMCVMAGPRAEASHATYDLVEGYTLTLFFGPSRDRPQEVVLHTPYDRYPTNWTRQLSASELVLGAPTVKPVR